MRKIIIAAALCVGYLIALNWYAPYHSQLAKKKRNPFPDKRYLATKEEVKRMRFHGVEFAESGKDGKPYFERDGKKIKL